MSNQSTDNRVEYNNVKPMYIIFASRKAIIMNKCFKRFNSATTRQKSRTIRRCYSKRCQT